MSIPIPPQETEHVPPDNGRRAMLLTGTAIGATSSFVTAAIVWPTMYPLAYAAVVTVGSVTGLALTILAELVRRHR